MKKLILVGFLLLVAAITIKAQEIFDVVKTNDLAKVKALVEKDASLVNSTDVTGNTPLHQAAITGSASIIDYLLSKGANINAGNTLINAPLHEALINGRDDVAKLLIEKGSDLEKQNNEGKVPVHYAARYNRLPILDILISRRVNLEVKEKNRDMTPLLYVALMTDYAEAAKKLIENGADINARDRSNWTPLNHAIHGRSNELIDLLLDKKADLDTSPSIGNAMLDMAAGLGSARLFKYVMEKGGESLFSKEIDSNNHMRSALTGGSVEIVRILQGKNIPMNLEADISGWTPLHYAARGNKPEMIEYLVKKKADINKRTNSGKSVYNVAEENGHQELLSLIVKLGGTTETQKFPVLKGPYYGQEPPGKELKRFAPGIVSAGHSSISVSPNGQEIYWASGPNIMMARIKDGKWTKPEIVSFSGKATADMYDDVPFVTPDNKRLFFTSLRPIGSGTRNKENIWYVEREGEGWGEPKPVSPEVNALSLHWQVSVSNSGTLYFAGSSESEGRGIYYSLLVNGDYTKPVKMEEIINKDGPHGPFISPDETYITFSRVVSGRSIPYISFKLKDGQWMEPVNLEKYIGMSNCMIVSPDKIYLFTQGGLWIDASFIEELRPKR